VGLFKSMKDLAEVSKSAKQMQDQQQQDAGYKPGLAGSMAQMGDMLGDMNEQLKELGGDSAERDKILAEGIDGQGVIVGMGTPARGASWFNLDLDLEVHVPGREAYRVANQYMVPASATLGQGVSLPLKVDPEDQAKIAIDWDSAAKPPARGEVRPASGAEAPPASSGDSGGGDTVADLERLAKLRDSGALTDAEFEQQKARILGS
jgi:hypothetical protein